jgi:hypothetical protein
MSCFFSPQDKMLNVEYWEARELIPLLGYRNKWQNFVDVITKAMVSCETTGNIVTDHFTGVSKMVGIGSGGWCWFSDVWGLPLGILAYQFR